MPTSRAPHAIAHRGDRAHAPENTMAAFREALDLGVDGIETDVRVSADGVAYLFHDADLERITGRPGAADELTIAQLRELDAASGSDAGRFTGARIPTLFELATECRGRARLVLDLKVAGTGDAIATALREAAFPIDGVAVCAWTEDQAFEVRAALPGAALVYIDEAPHAATNAADDDDDDDDAWYEDLATRGYSGLSLEWTKIDESAVRGAHRHDLSIVTWTVNRTEDMRAAIAAGVDGIITDDPGRLIGLLGS